MRRHPSWDAPRAEPISPLSDTGSRHGTLTWSATPSGSAASIKLHASHASTIRHQVTQQEVERLVSHPASRPLNAFVAQASNLSSSSSSGVSPRTTSRSLSMNDPLTHPSTSGTTTPTIRKKRIRVKTERRREQCRRNQARYRNKQKLSALQLEGTVDELRREVQQLQRQHASLHFAPVARLNADKVVRDTVDIFRFGLNVGRDESSLRFSTHRQLPELEQQIGFVTAAYHPDLLIGEMRGRTQFLEQLRRYSTLFDGIEISLEDVVPLSGRQASESFHVACTLDLTVAMHTLRHVFPHLMRAEHQHIRWKLLGQRLRCTLCGVFVFGDHGQVVELSWTIGFITALQSVLTINETVVVLGQAMIERDAYLTVSGEEITEPPLPTTGTPRSLANRTSRWDDAWSRPSSSEHDEYDDHDASGVMVRV